MNGEIIILSQALKLLETVQEFVDTNPNEVTALVDSAILIKAMYDELNPEGAAMPINRGICPQILRLVETIQEFVDTNPNEVGALADSALLVEAVSADLSLHEAVLVN
jgi:hypothetical protein